MSACRLMSGRVMIWHKLHKTQSINNRNCKFIFKLLITNIKISKGRIIMYNKHQLLIFTLILFSTMVLSGCENYAEKTHPSWVAPPAGTVFDDSTIYARISQAVQTDPDLRGINIDIKVKDGNVILSGTAANENQVTRINMHAWIADGVKKVDNQISIR